MPTEPRRIATYRPALWATIGILLAALIIASATQMPSHTDDEIERLLSNMAETITDGDEKGLADLINNEAGAKTLLSDYVDETFEPKGASINRIDGGYKVVVGRSHLWVTTAEEPWTVYVP